MLAQMPCTQNDILHKLFDNFIDAMTPVIELQKNDKFSHWKNFNSLLKEKPLNYYNIQSFLNILETEPKPIQQQQQQQQQQLHQVNSNKSIDNQKYYLKKDLSCKRSHKNTTYSKITSFQPKLQFTAHFEEFIKNYLQTQNYPMSYYSTFNLDQQVFVTVDQNSEEQQQSKFNNTESGFRLIAFEYFHSLLREDPLQFQEMLVNITSKQVKLLLPILTQTNTMVTEDNFYQSLIEGCQIILRDSDQPKQIIQPIEFFKLFQNDSQFCDCITFIVKDMVYKYALQQFTSGINNSFTDSQDLQQLLDYFTENQKIELSLNHLDIISCALQRKLEINELNHLTGKIEVHQFPSRNKQTFFQTNKMHQRSLSVFGNSSSREINKLQIVLFIVTENADNNNNNNNNNKSIFDIALGIWKSEFAVIAQNEEINQINSKSKNRSKFRSYEKSKTQINNNQTTPLEKYPSRNLLSNKHNQYPKDKRLLTEENSFNETYQQYQQMQSQRETKGRESMSSRNNANLQKSQNYNMKVEQAIPQTVVKKTGEVVDLLAQNTEKLNQLMTQKSNIFSRSQNTPKPLTQQQQTYFQNYQQPPPYQVYNSRPTSQYQAQLFPASVYTQPSSLHFQQQSCHSQQHSFQYFSTQQQQQQQQVFQQQQIDKGMVKNQPVPSNGFISNNLFY